MKKTEMNKRESETIGNRNRRRRRTSQDEDGGDSKWQRRERK